MTERERTGQAPAAEAARERGARSVARVVNAERTLEGDGFVVHRPLPTQVLSHWDPVLLIDEMGPAEHGPGEAVGTPRHPHRGFETLTYVIEGGIEHQDSFGNSGHVGAGGVQRMTAGAGIVHQETPERSLRERGGRMHAFQLWVNLARAQKMTAPAYQDVPGHAIPETALDGARIRVVTGELQGRRSPVQTLTPTLILHASLEPGAGLHVPVPEDWDVLAYPFAGEGRFGHEGTAAGPRRVPLFEHDGDGVSVTAGDTGLEALLIAGRPLGEPVARAGPFVMNEAHELRQAMEDFQAGRMGRIRPRALGDEDEQR